MNKLTTSAAYLSSLNVLEVNLANGTWLDLYIATTPNERARGLSNIQAMDADGMLFYYEKPSYVPFTMKNMLMDLSIGWYDSQGVMLKHGEFQAGSSEPLFSQRPFSYVIETPAGILPECDLKLKERNG